MIQKQIYSLIVAFLFIASAFPVLGAADGTSFALENGHERETQKKTLLKDKIEENLTAEPSKNQKILAAYGTLPETERGEISYEYWSALCRMAENIAADNAWKEDHYENGGAIIGHEVSRIGSIKIIIHEEQAEQIKEEDLMRFSKIVEEYAAAEGLNNILLTIEAEEMIPSRETDLNRYLSPILHPRENSIAPAPQNYSTDKIRPMVGGIRITTEKSAGTVGFVAREINEPDSYGLVTSAHILHFENQTIYQPQFDHNQTNAVGEYSRINEITDVVFIPQEKTDVLPYIYTGNSSAEGQLLPVIGYETQMPIGTGVEKSGIASGQTYGSYDGLRYNQVFTIKNGTYNYTVDCVGIIRENSEIEYSDHGDSGGPVYIRMNSTVNGAEQECAVLLGILEGGNGNGTVFYVPCEYIAEKLGVVPLTI